MNIKCMFKNHDYEIIATHESSSQNLWKCRKCNMHYIQHYGLGIGYQIKIPNIGGWIKYEIKDGK